LVGVSGWIGGIRTAVGAVVVMVSSPLGMSGARMNGAFGRLRSPPAHTASVAATLSAAAWGLARTASRAAVIDGQVTAGSP
jgi:hypothetical protein